MGCGVTKLLEEEDQEDDDVEPVAAHVTVSSSSSFFTLTPSIEKKESLVSSFCSVKVAMFDYDFFFCLFWLCCCNYVW